MKIKTKQKIAKKWFIKLQNIICHSIESIEKEYGSNIKFKKNNLPKYLLKEYLEQKIKQTSGLLEFL